MENDFLVEMGVTGLTGRLKRLNTLFVYQTRDFYRSKNVEIEPNWHVVFSLLQKRGELTVMQISEALHLSHPAVVKLIDKMKGKGYIESFKDPSDKRKYQLRLSEKAKSELPQLNKYWEAGEKALEEMLNHNTELLKQLEILEKNMCKADFKQRMEEILEKS